MPSFRQRRTLPRRTSRNVPPSLWGSWMRMGVGAAKAGPETHRRGEHAIPMGSSATMAAVAAVSVASTAARLFPAANSLGLKFEAELMALGTLATLGELIPGVWYGPTRPECRLRTQALGHSPRRKMHAPATKLPMVEPHNDVPKL